MTIEQPNVIDFTATDRARNEILLVISDHLPWDVDEGEHLWTLQSKINKYLAAIGSGELFEKCPDAIGRHIVIYVSAKYPLSEKACDFVEKCKATIRNFGFELRIKQPLPIAQSEIVLPRSRDSEL